MSDALIYIDDFKWNLSPNLFWQILSLGNANKPTMLSEYLT